jgi:cytochrome c biogenesis protein CcmG, thiol:disulfide interchange protein DsbE
MKRPALWIAVGIGIVAAAFVGVLATRHQAGDVQADSPLLGQQAPEVAGPSLDGSNVSLAQFRGRYVVVNFFASWCVPCQQEQPELTRFAQQHSAAGDAQIVSVVYQDSADAVRQMFAKSGSGWPVIDDSKAKVDFGVRGVPESFLVDPQGIVLARITGGVTEAGLDRLLTQAKERTS